MESKHTPGPWSAHKMIGMDGNPVSLDELVRDVRKRYLNSCMECGSTEFLFVSTTKDDGVDAEVCSLGNGPDAPWNVHLIAAAPDLLEACEEAKKKLGHLYGPDFPQGGYITALVERLNSAISKARGEK